MLVFQEIYIFQFLQKNLLMSSLKHVKVSIERDIWILYLKNT